MATRGGKSNTKPLFKLTKLEAALGTSLPLSADGKPLVVGICRTTPYGTFWTVKVVPTKHGRVVRGGPDDGTYTDFPILQTLIPRCFCVWENPKDGSYTTVIHALPKFGAFSPGDTDEAGATSSSFDSSLLSHPDLATIRAEEKGQRPHSRLPHFSRLHFWRPACWWHQGMPLCFSCGTQSRRWQCVSRVF